MVTVLKRKNTITTFESKMLNDEFEEYLKKQRIKTTFNGSEIAAFSWYKKVLGLA
jgi:hypothetical protein